MTDSADRRHARAASRAEISVVRSAYGPVPLAGRAGSQRQRAASPRLGGTRLASRRHGAPGDGVAVAAGCASCAARIPPSPGYLAAFSRSGTRILVLVWYGAFGRGVWDTCKLASFGRAAAGKAFTCHAWTQGLASERLTAALDPPGTPDAYFLLNAAGHVAYQSRCR